MPPEPVPADPGWDEDLAWLDCDPMTAHELKASLDRLCELDEGPGEEEDYEDYAPLTPEELAEIGEAASDELLAVKAATTGRRGPGQPGSARVFPGESASPAAAFGPGMALDVLPGCAGLAVAAEAAGDGGFDGVSEAELVGVLCAWGRMEAHAHARKLAAVAELARRNPGPLDQEFTADQLACALGESRGRAESLVGMAQTLPTHLPGTKAALDDGTISRYKAEIIARATALLDEDEARAAEAKVLDRAARLTPPGLRAAIARAVMEAAPGRRRSAARPRPGQRGWSGGSRTLATLRCWAASCPPTRSWPRTSRSPPGPRSCARPGWRATWTSSAPAPTWTCSWARTPAPPLRAGLALRSSDRQPGGRSAPASPDGSP